MNILYMSLSTEAKDILLSNLYYSPKTQFTSIKSLYDAVKNKNISHDEVKDFINKQETEQIFKKKKRIKHYFPITAKYKFEILQTDIADFSDISTTNEGYKYLLFVIDVFSRFLFVIPMKDKKAETVTYALKEVVKITQPNILNTDLGSEFISNAFIKYMTSQGVTDINYVDKGEHKKLAIVDRSVRTIREKLQKYMIMHHTNKYIDVLQDIIYNYNHSYNRGIKKKPSEVQEQDADILKINNKKYLDALQEEEIFNIGDRVRYIINRETFQKGSIPRWSKTVHTIITSSQHSYILENGKSYKYYELQKVNEVRKIDKQIQQPTKEQMKQQRTKERRTKKEGINLSNIIEGKRQRIQTDKFIN